MTSKSVLERCVARILKLKMQTKEEEFEKEIESFEFIFDVYTKTSGIACKKQSLFRLSKSQSNQKTFAFPPSPLPPQLF